MALWLSRLCNMIAMFFVLLGWVFLMILCNLGRLFLILMTMIFLPLKTWRNYSRLGITWDTNWMICDLFCSVALNIWVTCKICPSIHDRFPRQFGEFLADLPHKIVRIILLCWGDVFRFSLGVASPSCPFCPVNLHFHHLSECPNVPFASQVVSWGHMVLLFRNLDWCTFVSSLMLTLIWMSSTSFFGRRSCDRVQAFLRGDVRVD